MKIKIQKTFPRKIKAAIFYFLMAIVVLMLLIYFYIKDKDYSLFLYLISIPFILWIAFINLKEKKQSIEIDKIDSFELINEDGGIIFSTLKAEENGIISYSEKI